MKTDSKIDREFLMRMLRLQEIHDEELKYVVSETQTGVILINGRILHQRSKRGL